MQTLPPSITVRGAPNRCAREPASKLPNGAIPMNAIV